MERQLTARQALAYESFVRHGSQWVRTNAPHPWDTATDPSDKPPPPPIQSPMRYPYASLVAVRLSELCRCGCGIGYLFEISGGRQRLDCAACERFIEFRRWPVDVLDGATE